MSRNELVAIMNSLSPVEQMICRPGMFSQALALAAMAAESQGVDSDVAPVSMRPTQAAATVKPSR